MSKSYTMDLLAAWVATITVPADGDTWQESVTDVIFESIGKRLGYLKTAVDARVGLTGNETIAGNKTFSGDVAFTGPSFDATAVTIDANVVALTGSVSFQSGAEGIINRIQTTADANTNLSIGYETVRVPALTGNRQYNLPDVAASAGLRIRLVRTRTADAFTATLVHNAAGSTIGIISASNAGWIEAESDGATWKATAWGGTVTSILTTA